MRSHLCQRVTTDNGSETNERLERGTSGDSPNDEEVDGCGTIREAGSI